MSHRLALIVVLPVLLLVAYVAWLRSGPEWRLSARNTAAGLAIEVYQGAAAEPSFKTLLPGRSLSTELNRVGRRDAPEGQVRTTFYDETLLPGRWTVVVAETELDIMERGLFVDGNPTD